MLSELEFFSTRGLVSGQLLEHIVKGCLDGAPLSINGAKTSYAAVLLAALQKKAERRMLCICPNYTQTRALVEDFSALGLSAQCLSWHQTKPYQAVAPSSARFSERLHALFAFAFQNTILCVPADAVLHVVPPLTAVEQLSLKLQLGDPCSPTQLAAKLVEWGYTRVSQILLRGEFSLRGEIIDVFPPYRDQPIRISLDFDSIEAIHALDVETQLSGDALTETMLTSCSEIQWTTKKLQLLQQQSYALEHDLQEPQIQIEGAEYYASLLYPDSYIDDYLEKDDILVQFDPALIKQQALQYRDDFQAAHIESGTLFPPHEVILRQTDAFKTPTIVLHPTKGDAGIDLSVQHVTRFSGNIQLARKEIEQLQKKDYRVYILTRSTTQQMRFQHLFPDTEVYDRALHTGFMLPQEKIAVFSEEDILGIRIHPQTQNRSIPIRSFSAIEENTYVVHVHHGIGLFRGLKRMQVGSVERDYLVVEYAQEDSIFVPIDQIHLLQRYIGEEHPKKDVIGGSSWKQKKKRVQKSLEDIADRLINLQAERESMEGYAFSADGELQELFESTFPFTETPDQLQALQEIKGDMESNRPMDRLLCGDVGFGKTEIAMRAAFKAVMDSKQVAILAPTTILVEQHYETFSARMQNFPLRIAMLSRFVATKDVKKILLDLQEGKVDIIIGTHKLLQASVHFKDLGLIVIDEEHRFGVKHKEILKEWKKNTDCLMMSATPIPRTLHMSLIELRQMSLLRTPPENRKPINTTIAKFDLKLVKEAIEAELARDGQVFFLHNRIDSLEQIRQLIQTAVPQASVACVHGQMPAEKLEETMWKFIHERYNVLVSTTIIENGLDIRNVNTIIIDRADMYGVSQLYQLRGRVGRSDRHAYAYLLYPEKNYLTDIALRRLEVLRDHTELGVGFQIAMHDMEMRGVGNVVGKEQSGNIYQLGLELYLTLLNQAVQQRRNMNTQLQHKEVNIEIKHTAYIPSEYIEDIHQKIQLYQEIQTRQNFSELSASMRRTIDQYGHLPSEVTLLYTIARLRISCVLCGISTIKERRSYVNLRLWEDNHVAMDALLKKVEENTVTLQSDGSFNYVSESENTQEKCDQLIDFITSITNADSKESIASDPQQMKLQHSKSSKR